MTRKLIALVAAAAIAATGFSAVPAQARDRGDTATIVTGAILGATLASDRNKNRKHHGQVSRGQYRGHGYYAPPPHARAYGYRAQRNHGYRSHRGLAYRPYYGPRSYGYAGGRSSHHRR
ncbi:hypothetical protein [Roseovarius autotrophicus]|uniref:hypothetical protein n=1 Tax=Roseovarius autotrophicus TaxID=2824121 RepID=UPI0019FF62EA|nr:hypothetical protein [Roseovarius autotrophicus]MBE0453663.1 hypothetical protein [Roseovarius sp.]